MSKITLCGHDKAMIAAYLSEHYHDFAQHLEENGYSDPEVDADGIIEVLEIEARNADD